jgi:hypothetical protein
MIERFRAIVSVRARSGQNGIPSVGEMKTQSLRGTAMPTSGTLLRCIARFVGLVRRLKRAGFAERTTASLFVILAAVAEVARVSHRQLPPDWLLSTCAPCTKSLTHSAFSCRRARANLPGWLLRSMSGRRSDAGSVIYQMRLYSGGRDFMLLQGRCRMRFELQRQSGPKPTSRG